MRNKGTNMIGTLVALIIGYYAGHELREPEIKKVIIEKEVIKWKKPTIIYKA